MDAAEQAIAASAAERHAEEQKKLAEPKTKETEAALEDVAAEKERADNQLEKAQLSQSRFLKEKAEAALKAKDYGTAALLAMEGLPDETGA